MKTLVSGSSGLIGSALIPVLEDAGHEVVRLVRSRPEPGSNSVFWDPAAGTIDTAGLEGLDAVVHLAGENVAGRWTEEKKAKIRDSRIKGTRLLSESLAALGSPPKVLASASATGYYGSRGDEVLTEDSPPGSGFLASLCVEWEAATEPAQKEIRVVNTRFGVVLAPKGGALEQMLLPFRMGFGARLGTGKQYMSWVAIDDLVRAVEFVLTTEALRGPVNVVSPNPVTNEEFTEILGEVISRPARLSVPSFALKLAFGEVADEVLLTSARVTPAKLLAAGFVFQYPDIEGALRHVLTE